MNIKRETLEGINEEKNIEFKPSVNLLNTQDTKMKLSKETVDKKESELQPTVFFRNTNKAEMQPTVIFRDAHGDSYVDRECSMPIYLDEMQDEMQDEVVKTEKAEEVVRALVTEYGLLIDDVTHNKPVEGKERAAILWKRIEELPPDYRERVKEHIFEGRVEYEKIRDHEDFWKAVKDRINSKEELVNGGITIEKDLEYEPWLSGYVKKDGWILACEDENRNKYRRLFRCDMQCLEVREMLIDSNEKSKQRLLKIKVKTVSEEETFLVDMSWDGKTIEGKFRRVLGFKVASGVQFEREIKNLLSELALGAEKKKILIEQGWQKIEGKMYYVYDRRPEIQGYKVQCGKYILQKDMYNTIDIWNKAMNVFNEKKVAGPILLYALYGVTYRLFMDAHKRPTGILFVAGETGAMKTSVSKVFFIMFNTDEDASVMPFQSTPASLDPAIKEAKDALLLVDDYCPNSTMTKEGCRQMQQVLDRLIRIFGDATSRRKSDSEFKLVEAPRATGGAVATGEIEAEGRSSCLRLITTELKRGDICGENLQYFQDERTLWSTFLARYVHYLEANYGHLVHMIETDYSQLRAEAGKWLHEARDVDHYVECAIINSFLCDFLQKEGMSSKEAEFVYGILNDGLAYHIGKSENMAIEQNPDLIVLEAVVNVLSDGSIKLAETGSVYAGNGDYSGYKSEDGVYVEEAILKREVALYLKTVYGDFVFDRKKLLKILYERFGVIRKFKNGGANFKFTTTKRKLGNKIPIVVVSLEKAEAILNE